MNDQKTSLHSRTSDVLSRYGRDAKGTDSAQYGEIESLIHELTVYQAELEQQNEELRNLQVSLEQSRNRYYELFDLAPVGYLITDADGSIQKANSTAASLLKRSPLQIQGKPLLSYIDVKDHLRVRSFFKHMQTDNDPAPIQVTLRRKDQGAARVVQLDGLQLRREFDLATELLITLTDQTDLMAAQNSLAKSEKLYRRLIDSSEDHICMLSPDGRYLASNDQVDHLGLTRAEDLVGKKLSEVLAGRELEEFAKGVKEVIETGQSIGFEHNVTCNGRTLNCNSSLYPIFESDSLWAIGCICRDVTQVKVAIREREEFQRQLHQAQKLESIGTLAAGIAHDFNNILAVIIGFTELSRELAKHEPELQENLEEVFNAAIRAKNLVGQILSFAKKKESRKEMVRLDSIAQETTRFLRSVIPRTIAIEERYNSSGMVVADPVQLHQIIMNLCTNAAQAIGDDGGKIRLDLSEVDGGVDAASTPVSLSSPTDKQYIKLEIQDDGCGIPEEILDKIFEPYFTTKEQGKGSGMGLSVVHGLVTSFGGTIDVTSRVHEGTCFRIYLPLADSKEHSPHAPTDGETANPGKTGRILLVDDEKAILKANKRILENQGHRVTAFHSAQEALQYFTDNRDSLDLLITDMAMPLMDGAQLSRAILEMVPDFPIILCTGFSSYMDEEKSRSLGIREYLEKPVPADVLLATVQRQLRPQPS